MTLHSCAYRSHLPIIIICDFWWHHHSIPTGNPTPAVILVKKTVSAWILSLRLFASVAARVNLLSNLHSWTFRSHWWICRMESYSVIHPKWAQRVVLSESWMLDRLPHFLLGTSHKPIDYDQHQHRSLDEWTTGLQRPSSGGGPYLLWGSDIVLSQLSCLHIFISSPCWQAHI